MRHVIFVTLVCVSLAGCGDQRIILRKERDPSQAEPAAPLPVGRYTIIHSPHLQSDTVLLDTSTGTSWQMVSSTPRDPDGTLSWQMMSPPEGRDK